MNITKLKTEKPKVVFLSFLDFLPHEQMQQTLSEPSSLRNILIDDFFSSQVPAPLPGSTEVTTSRAVKCFDYLMVSHLSKLQIWKKKNNFIKILDGPLGSPPLHQELCEQKDQVLPITEASSHK